MKKILITAAFCVLVTLSYAQTENTFDTKNEIGFSLFSAGLQLSPKIDFIQKYTRPHFYYRHFFNEKTALRFSVGPRYSGVDLGFSSTWELGVERYKHLSDRWQIYGGAQLGGYLGNIGEFLSPTYGIGGDVVGGVRFQMSKRFVLNTEVVGTARNYWTPNTNQQAFQTGIYANFLKIGYSF